MRILIITGTFRPSINGVAISTEVLVKNLIKLGHTVLTLAPQTFDKNQLDKNILRYPSIPNLFIPDYPIPLLPLTPQIYEEVKKFNPEIIHAQHPFHIGFVAKLISDQLRIPLVFTYHTKNDYYADEYFKFLPKEVRDEFIVNKVLDFSKKCNLVIAPSHEIEMFLKNKRVKNVEVIPSIVDDLKRTRESKNTLRKKLNLPIHKNILLFVGRLAIEKNVDLIIESMKYVPSDLVLLICGTGPLEKEIRKKTKMLKLSKRVLIKGRIEREKIGDYYSASDNFYYSSRSETQALIYWEALSFGLPIISVDSKVAREWVKSTFGVVSKNNPQSMAKSLEAINLKDYKSLSQKALLYSKKFSSKKSATKMVQAYKKLI